MSDPKPKIQKFVVDRFGVQARLAYIKPGAYAGISISGAPIIKLSWQEFITNYKHI